nr:hypothetical protein [Tanacetum cinerariifolium]
MMVSQLKISDLGELTYYLGIEVSQGNDEIKQERYARKILKEAGIKIAMRLYIKWRMISSCQKLMMNQKLKLPNIERCDSSHNVDIDDERSTTEHIFYLGTSSITWCSQKQTTVPLSLCEAEFMATTTATVDNKSSIALSKNPVFHGRSKHIHTRYHFIRECVGNKHVMVEHVSEENQRANPLTKALARIRRGPIQAIFIVKLRFKAITFKRVRRGDELARYIRGANTSPPRHHTKVVRQKDVRRRSEKEKDIVLLRWDMKGPIFDIIPKKVLYEERYSGNEKVADIIERGVWIWPLHWYSRFPHLCNISVPHLTYNENDKVVWLDSQREKKIFSTSQVWYDLKRKCGKVDWYHVILFSQFQPRQAFILWLAILGRLATKDRVGKWSGNTKMECLLCNKKDSHYHLFFKCEFSKNIWEMLRKKMSNMSNQDDLTSIVSKISLSKAKNNLWRIVNTLVLAAAVYFIWQKRNRRLFKQEKRYVEQILKIKTNEFQSG